MKNPTAEPGDIPEVVDTIRVLQDVGVFEPAYLVVTLELMSNGTVRWKNLQEPEGF